MTKLMIFERENELVMFRYVLMGEKDIVDCFKYLDMTFYKYGQWLRTQTLISQYDIRKV